jgi:hypothetical protein
MGIPPPHMVLQRIFSGNTATAIPPMKPKSAETPDYWLPTEPATPSPTTPPTTPTAHT